MTVDLSEFRKRPSKRCVVAQRADEFTPDDRAKYEAAMKTDDITNVSITNFFKSRGLKMNNDSLRCHRLGLCCCD